MTNQLFYGDNLQVLRDCIATESVPMVRDLGHVVDREKAKIGVFITLAEPTKPMQTEAVKAGFYQTPYGKYPKIQLLTIEAVIRGQKTGHPSS